MDVRPLGFEWWPRGRVAKALLIGLGSLVVTCSATAVGAFVGMVGRQAWETLSAVEAPAVLSWARGVALAGAGILVLGALCFAVQRRARGRMLWGRMVPRRQASR